MKMHALGLVLLLGLEHAFWWTPPSPFRKFLEKSQICMFPPKVTTLTVYVDNDSTAVELTKRQLLAQTKSSAVARTAVYQWNKLNTAVRMLVHKTKVRYNVIIIIHNVVITAVLIDP